LASLRGRAGGITRAVLDFSQSGNELLLPVREGYRGTSEHTDAH
jgi:hypothetical protein